MREFLWQMHQLNSKFYQNNLIRNNWELGSRMLPPAARLFPSKRLCNAPFDHEREALRTLHVAEVSVRPGREEEPIPPQWQIWAKSVVVGAVPVAAAVQCGREESPTGALDPAWGDQQASFQHIYGHGIGVEGVQGSMRVGVKACRRGQVGCFSPATVSWLSRLGPQ